MIASSLNTFIDPLADKACLSQVNGGFLDATALRVARLQPHGVFVFPYAPGRWRVVQMQGSLPRIVGNGESLLEALDEAEDFLRAL